MPSALRKQFPEEEQTHFVLNRGFDKYLVLHPQKEWDEQIEIMRSKNVYVRKNREFIRRFTNGAVQIELDGSSRILIPKPLMEYGGLSKEIVLVAQIDKVEIWDKAAYEAWLDSGEFDMEQLAEEVMGDIQRSEKE